MAIATRTNVAPVADYYDKNGIRIDAGTVGTLTYSTAKTGTGGRRGWVFNANGFDYPIKAADLFRFVPRSELASATLGHDVAEGEAILCAYCSTAVHAFEVLPTAGRVPGSSCKECYVVHVVNKRSAADNFEAMMNAFGGGAVRR
jgi:hypothetical protein